MYRVQINLDSLLAVMTYAGVDGRTRSAENAKVFADKLEADNFMAEKYPGEAYRLIPVD